MSQKQHGCDVMSVCRRHSLRVCVYVLVSVSSMPAQWFKYSTWPTVPADINNAIATKTHLHYISAVLTLKPEKWWTEGGRRGKERKGGKRGRPRIHENSAAHTLASAAKSWAGQQCACVCVYGSVCVRHSSVRWMPRSEQSWRQTVLSYCVLVELTSPSPCTPASQL